MNVLMIVWMLFFVTLSVVSEISEVEGMFIPVGCYRDKHIKGVRPLPDLLVNYRTNGGLDWSNLYDSVIQPCAIASMDKGYEYFGVEFYGECWGGVKGNVTYNLDGISTHCTHGVGKGFALMVYKKITTETECLHYQTLSDANRALSYQGGRKCDIGLDSDQNAWYRFTGDAGNAMAHNCTYADRCGTYLTGWLNGNPPLVQEGIVKRKVCFSSKTESNSGKCCEDYSHVNVRNCGRFYVYSKLGSAVAGCPMRFCGNQGQALA